MSEDYKKSRMESILAEVESTQRSLLDENPFWVAAKDGKLTLNHLRGVIKEGYHTANPINNNLSSLVLKATDYDMRLRLAEVVVEELPHARMNFIMGKNIGLTPDEIENHHPLAETQAYTNFVINTFHYKSLAESMVLLLISEGFVQKMSALMVKSLEKFYNLNENQSGLYGVHAKDDIEHVEGASEDLSKMIKTDADKERCIHIVQDAGRLIDIRYRRYYTVYA